MRLKFTVANIRKLCRPPKPGELTRNGKRVRVKTYWDTEEPGLGLVVRPPRMDSDGKETSGLNATFVYQREVEKRTYKRTIGRLGAWTVEKARERARAIRYEMDQLDYGDRESARRVTLRDALRLHVERMETRGNTPRSVATVRTEVEKYLADWLDRPLVRIAGEDCHERHRRQTRKHGPYIANRVMRHLRTCYRTAARVYSALPREAPTASVTMNDERPSEKHIEWPDLPAWWARVHAMANPVRRDLNLFILFTGLRSTDAKTVRWVDADLEAGTLHRPSPKGGPRRAFTIPVSGFVLDLLRRRREENGVLFTGGDVGWVFPARRRDGTTSHVREVKEQRYVKTEDGVRKRTAMPGPHALRHTFANAGHEAMLRELDLGILMNHAPPRPRGNVTRGYIHPSMDHLRECTEKVASYLLEKAGQREAKRDAG